MNETLRKPLAIRAIEWVAALLTASMVAAIFVQVSNRYVFNSPLAWTEEVARFIFIWLSFLGAFLALRDRAHISITAVMKCFSPGVQATVSSTITVLLFGYMAVLCWVGVTVAIETRDTFSAALELSFLYVHAAIPVGAGLMALTLLGTLWRLPRAVLLRGIGIGAGLLGLIWLLFGGGAWTGQALTLVAVVILALLIVCGAPIAFSMGVASTLFLILYEKIPLMVTHTRMVGGMDSFPLLAVPFFVLAGELMNTGGVTHRLVSLAKVLVGHVRGGLGMVVVVGEYFFSGISGSTVADVSAIGSLLVPAMKKAGYRPAESVSIVSAATAMGILVPPCIMMVVLGGMTGMSVGALFLAGFIPAAVLALCIMGLIYVQAVRTKLPLEPRPTLREAGQAVVGAIIPLLLPVIIFGGILSGAATATEVSVIAVAYALIVGLFVYKEIPANQIVPILTRTATITGTVMFLCGSSSVLSWIFSINKVPQLVGGLVTQISTSPLVFVLLCDLTFILLGAVLEGLPALLILIPIFLPFSSQFHIDPLHLGILAIASIGIGIFLPPIGVGMFIACTFAEIEIEKVIIPFVPYLIVLLIGLFIISYFPWFTVFLPNIVFPGK
jgi:C4-dicarboxylate transporter, DctM subunit